MIEKLYKLTNGASQTHDDCQWSEGRTYKLPEKANPRLCSGDVLHAYRNADLALLLNPIHANFYNVLLWEATGKVVVEDWGKVGCFELTTVRQLPLPTWYTNTESRRRTQLLFAILCAEEVLPIYEAKYPDNLRPREAINVARGVLGGTVSMAEATGITWEIGQIEDASVAWAVDVVESVVLTVRAPEAITAAAAAAGATRAAAATKIKIDFAGLAKRAAEEGHIL